jgi:hypothetical protein
MMVMRIDLQLTRASSQTSVIVSCRSGWGLAQMVLNTVVN